mmetsp:Transcript_998/g.2861  ORF Transcript_998/g.2861 Transcript_998/m.2861 type:complete len:211 (-) Transcript_998:805-1437(-)
MRPLPSSLARFASDAAAALALRATLYLLAVALTPSTSACLLLRCDGDALVSLRSSPLVAARAPVLSAVTSSPAQSNSCASLTAQPAPSAPSLCTEASSVADGASSVAIESESVASWKTPRGRYIEAGGGGGAGLTTSVAPTTPSAGNPTPAMPSAPTVRGEAGSVWQSPGGASVNSASCARRASHLSMISSGRSSIPGAKVSTCGVSALA